MGVRGLLASLLIALAAIGSAMAAPAITHRSGHVAADATKNIALGAIGAPRASGITPYVIGGFTAPVSSWPYLVAVVSPIGLCSGELVGASWILTARHCVTTQTGSVYGPGLIRVTVGGGALLMRRNWQIPRRIAPYPGYSATAAVGDLALIELRHPTTRQTVDLATANPDPTGNWPVRIAGWGLTSDFGLTPNAPQAATTELWNQAYCVATEPAGVYDPTTEICAGGPDQAGVSQYPSVCSGDSGGPLVLSGPGGPWTDRLVGITDYGTTVGCDANPSVFQDIPAHLGWILRTSGLGPVRVLRARQTAAGRTIATINVWLRLAEARTTVAVLGPDGTVVASARSQAWHHAPIRLTIRGLRPGAHSTGYRVVTVNAYGTAGPIPVRLRTLAG